MSHDGDLSSIGYIYANRCNMYKFRFCVFDAVSVFDVLELYNILCLGMDHFGLNFNHLILL